MKSNNGSLLTDSLRKSLIEHKNVFQILNKKKIYFAHMSVGYNIIEGAKVLDEKYQLELNIHELQEGDSILEGGLNHGKIGHNTKPFAKIASFEGMFDTHKLDDADYAFFKFCYIDFNDSTDVDSVFNTYCETIDKIKIDFPKVQIVHLTAPLRIIESGIKGFFKEMLGKSIGYEANKRRNEFNKLLIKKYKGVDPIFDLAKYESTMIDGERVSMKKNKEMVYSLNPQYTSDGGHLNALGREFIASQFLVFISQTFSSEIKPINNQL